ncbi:hypothetical protein [Halonatronum saccharophilum]|uniref:hypothetical protein n=1 Tax=Halonatronum saccharophilum TaxID=150060 RepID=UPI0004893047|nr:hypothetical protein [Halonatronum saccharophilum]
MKRVVFLLFLVIIISNPAFAQSSEGRFVIFLMDGVDIFELREVETPNLDILIDEGSIALMNTRTAGGLDSEDAYLTIGSGDRALAGKMAHLSFNKDEDYLGFKASQVYLSRVLKGSLKGEVLNLDIANLVALNKRNDYRPKVGNLGERLKESGFKVTVLGNADFLDEKRRGATLIGIDEDGVVYQGDVGQMMKLSSDQHPSLHITNKSYLLKRYNDYLPKSDLLIIESGDTSRVESVKSLVMEDRFDKEKVKAIKRVDSLLGHIVKELDFNKDYIMVLTPTLSKQAIAKGNRLGFVTLVGPEIERGLLRSPTTKRAGIVSNLDISPTVYSYLLGEDNSSFTGSKIGYIKSDKGLDYLEEISHLVNRTFRLRPTLIKGFIILQIILLALVGLMLIANGMLPNFIKLNISCFIIGILWIPLLFLLSSFYIMNNIFIMGILSILLTGFLAYLTRGYFKSKLAPLLISSLSITIILIVDIIFGSNLIKTSILGYSPVIGARYYGIGNEFMGILIGSSIVSLTMVKDFFNLSIKLIAIILVSISIVIGHPLFGANFGGLLTSTSAFLLIYFWLKGYQWDLTLVLKFLFIISIIVLSIISLDIINFFGEQSHIGRTLSQIRSGGLGEILVIIYRKFSMNLKLLRWTIWTKVLIAFIIIIFILLKNPKGRIEEILFDYPNLGIGLKGAIIASLITMIVNDSGVVAAATLLFFPVFVLVYLVIEK